ncbi:LPD38 domain-containing protein [Burkholderia sp. LMG 13014]|nr:LPD38 domain-containing protein [Burkholderia sp. LMG 13014]
MLTTERGKVSAEIDRRNEGAPAPAEPVTAAKVEEPAAEAARATLTPEQVAKNKEDALYPRVLEMLQGREAIRPQDIMAATDVGYERASRALETAEAEGHVGALREDGTREVTNPQEDTNAGTAVSADRAGIDAQARASVQSKPESAAAQPGSESDSAGAPAGAVAADQQSAAVKDAYDGKWFGSREKAQGFLDKKKAGETHEIVQTGKVRFEIKPKVAEGMERFAPETGTLGIPRAEMPQVPTQSHGALVNHLNAQGIEHETKMVPAAELKPTQAEFSPEKVAQAKEAAGDRAVIVSNDGHIIDGHHQALAAAEEGKDVKAIVLDAPVDKALNAVKNSPSAQQAADDAAARWARATDTERAAFLSRAGYSNDGKLNLAGRRLLRSPLDQMAPSARGKIESAMQARTAPAVQPVATPGSGVLKRMNELVRAKTLEEVDAVARAEDAAWAATDKPEVSHEAAHAELMRRIDRKRETMQDEPQAERDDSSAAKQAAARDFVRAARENGAKQVADVMPGVKDGRTFQTGAPFVKPGFIMVDGPKGEQFRLADLWKATEPPAATPKKPGAKVEPNRVHRVLGDAREGDTVTPSADIGYAKGGQSYEIERIGRNGETTVRNTATNARTTWSRAELERAAHQGVTLEKQQSAAEPAPQSDLTKARNDLIEMRTRVEEQGRVVDDRLLDKVRQQEKLVRDLEAANDGAPTEPTPPNGTDRFAGNKLFTADKVEAARQRMRSKLTQLNAGLDPELLTDGMTIAGAYIEAGVRDFTAYAKAMTSDLGDAVKPYLLSFWEAARNYPGLETEGMTSVQDSKHLHDSLIASQSASSTMQSKEVAQNDGNATAGSADQGAPEQSAGRVSSDAGGRDTERVPEQSARRDAGSDQRGAAERDRQSRDAGQSAVRGEAAAENAGDQHGGEGGRGDRARASDGDDRGAVSRVGNDHRVKPGELKRAGSWRSTAEQNVRIAELVKQLEQEGRRPTSDEAELLTKFTGWGASEIANSIFPDRYGRYKDSQWQALGERLKATLTPEQYEQAKRTTQYAHYTSEGVIRSIYDGLRRLGFAGGKMLEPGMGIGLFKGLMPDSMAATSQYTGVEYDALTGAIAKLLYPQSNIIVGDFTKTAMPREFFDAAIGNPPFASVVVTNDPEYKKQGFMLHDYFFAKTLDRVKPGGMLVFVTSKGTMDKASDRARRYLADRANLIGAVRLPQTAFKDNAGTEVVTDVLFLQKRGAGVEDNGVKWLGTAEVQTPQGLAQINEYFAAHPEMVLGAHALTGSMYRANEYTVMPEPGVDMDAAFAKAIANLPEGVYQPGAKNPAASKAVALERDFNPTHRKEGGLYVGESGNLMQVDSGTGIELTHRRGADGKQIALKPSDKAFLKSWTGLRDALKQAQLDQLSDGAWEKSLKALSDAYDGFVAKHGNLLAYSTITRTADDGVETVTKRFKNDPLLRLDVDGALAYSLEHIKENGDIIKAPVLSERVLQRPREPEIKTTNDAMFVSLNNKGVLDLDDVARLSSMSRQDVIDALGTSIYQDPAKGWQTSDAYLSGNVVRKLAEAQAAARSDRKYQRNVEALLAVQPKPLGPTDITVKLGQNWIPASDVAAFASEALNENIDVSYNSRLGNWSAEQTGSNYSEFNAPKMNAGQILDAVLNNRQIKVTFRDDQGKTHVDAEATEKANDVAQKMRAAFSRWIWTDTKRSDRLVNHYNENFNNIAPRQFDGSHLTLPGVSLRFDLRENQKRAIWRGIQEGDMYLAHAVGAGKTFTMIATGMEERRLGLSNKPMYAVPNHMLAQFAREFLELYPAANIMVADEQNFHTHNRRRFVAQAALNNPDAIIITHSAFGRIGMSDEYAAAFIRDQIGEWKTALAETDKGDRITRKQIERRIEQLERRLEAKQGGEKKDKVLSFEELGVDRLFVDEAHEFRKLDFATQQSNIKGIDPSGSQRAMDLFMKAQYLRSKKPGRALVMASGTPITNTMGELYTVQRFFQPEQMAEDGLDTFDAWSNQYGDVVAGFEQNAAGGYEVVSRFAKFQNVPELMRRVRSFMDILTSSQLSQYVDRPAIDGGGRQIMVTPEPFGYKAYQKALEQRITAIRNRKGPPSKGQDIILNVIADGRFSAIDMRFVDPTAPSDPNSKLNQMLDAVIADYHAAADYEYTTNGKVDPNKGASHIIFTDIGLGEQSAKNRGFDMKAWIEKRLTDGGVAREHIAFMRDNKEHAKKERLFADMREGKKRVLVGGKDMETGVNVQKRLYTEEHLDAPWFPASVEQREGRIIRQGNQNKQVRIRAWATKGSYDSTMWGMNGRKARFIEQALNGDDSVRSLEDVSEASAFDMAAALASGDERYLKMAGLKADVERLERLSYAHHDEQNKLRRDKHWAETQVERDNMLAGEIKAALEKRTPIRAGEFTGMVGKTAYDKRDEFSGAIFNRFKELAGKETDTAEQIGEIGGFPIMFHGTQLKGSGEYIAAVSVDIPGDPAPLVSLPLDPDLPVGGIATRAANQVNNLDNQLAQLTARVQQNERRVDQIGNRLGAPFPEQAELLEKMAQLNSLESELTSEKAAENAPAPSSDAAAATVEVEGRTDETRYSAAADVARDGHAALTADTLAQTLKGGEFGDAVSRMIESGSVVLHDTAQSIPVANAPANVRGATTPDGTIHLVAANLTPESAAAVLLHEAFHQGAQRLVGSDAWSKLLGRLKALHSQARQSNGRARQFFDAARERVASAQRDGAAVPEMTAEEFGAYTVEHYDQAPAAFARWVDDVAGGVKAWLLRRFGKQLGAVTPAQLRALAAAALRDHAGGPTDGARFSVGGQQANPPAPGGLTPPAPSRFDRLQATVQDNMNRVKQVQERIKKLTGVKELGNYDYYRAEANRPGRVAARLEDAKKQLTGPLMERLAKSGHTPEQLEELLHAQHAQERNERIAAINEAMPDGGSGMTTADANATIAKYAGNAELQSIADQARDIARATLDLKHAYGLISQEDHDTLAKAYKNYVPLKGDGEYGPKVKRAMGHEERDEHILQNIARDYDQAVVVGEKNLARQSLLALVADNPDRELWTIGVPPRGRYVAGKVYNVVDGGGQTVGSFATRSQVNAFLEGSGPQAATYQVLDSNGDRVAEFVKPLQDNEVMVYVKGEPVRIQINDEALAHQIRPLDQARMHPILEMMRGVNRYFSKIYTGYNPAFILRNASRDALTGTINMVGHEGAAVAAKAWAKYPAAVKALGQWAATGKEPAGDVGKLLKEYRMHGGKTGASWMSDLEAQGKSLEQMYEDAYGARGYLKDGQNLKAAKVAGRKIVGGMAHVVEIANQATENALRLSLYMALRGQGETPGRAAQAAKSVTVDFDRKGTMTPALGAIYLFLNPAIQGTANAMRTLASGEHRGQALVALGMLATLGFFAGAAGMDDDKDRWLGEGWDTRTKNFIFGIGNHTLRVPLSQEFSPAYAFGVAMAEATRGEGAMKSAARMVSSFLDAYFPLNGAYNPDSDNHTLDAFMSSVPTVIKPLAETAANRNHFGSQIVPDTPSTKAQPDNLKMFRGTKGSVYDALAQQIAAAGELTGARRYENDLTKVSPETLKYIWRTYTGGLGQFVTDSIGAAGLAGSDISSMSSSDVPIVKDFWRQNDVKPLRSRYYDLAREAKAAADEFHVAKKAADGEALDDIFARPEQAEMISLDRMTQRYGKAISAIRDEEVTINADKALSTAEKRARLKELEGDEESLYRSALDAFRRP